MIVRLTQLLLGLAYVLIGVTLWPFEVAYRRLVHRPYHGCAPDSSRAAVNPVRVIMVRCWRCRLSRLLTGAWSHQRHEAAGRP